MLNKKNFQYFVKLCIYASFFIPLIVVPSSYIFPFIVPKVLLFRSIVMLMLGGYALLLVANWKEYAPKRTFLNALMSIFLLSFAVSTFWGVDPYHSFWDNHERMLGLFTILHYILYYFICSAVFKDWEEWKQALRIFLIAGSIVMFVGLLQVISPNLLLNQGSDRVASTLGNPIYVGGYGLFLMFSAFLLYLKENSRPWKWIEAVLGFVALGGVFYSGTRGSLLGLVVGVVLAAILYAAFLKEQPFIRKGILVCLIAGLVASGILFIFRKTDFVQRIPAVGRAFNTSFTDFEQSPRAIAWKIAVDSWKEKPLIGWGPNNFFYAFNKYYNPKSLNFGYGETWFDNAHNIVLNTLAVQGAFGVLSYLAFFVGGIIVLWLAFKRKQVDLHMMVIGGAFLVAHFVHNITVFENPTSYLYFVFWLAFVNRISSKKYNLLENQATNSSQIKAKPDRLVGSGLVAVTGVLISGLIFIFNVQPARANKSSLIALSFVNNSTVDQAIEKIGVALSFDSPHIDDIRGDIGRSILGVVSQNYQKMDKQKAVQLINTIFPSLQENIKLHPQDVRNYIVLSEFSRLRAMIDNEDVFIKEGEKYLDMALIYSPRRQQIIYALVDFKQALGKNEEAKKLLEQTIQDNPKIAEGYLRLAYLLKSFLNQPQKAVEVINNARKNDVEFSSTEEQQIKSLLGETSPTSSAVKK